MSLFKVKDEAKSNFGMSNIYACNNSLASVNSGCMLLALRKISRYWVKNHPVPAQHNSKHSFRELCFKGSQSPHLGSNCF
jgi:hypothetical protein